MEIAFPRLTRELRVQVIRDILWYRGSKTDPIAVVLVRDPLGQWRDEALVTTDPNATAAFVIQGYCRRWSVELAFFDSKQHLGLHDPRVRSERSRGASPPDGMVPGIAGDPVVLRGWTSWFPSREGPPVVQEEGCADIHGHAGSITVADVGTRDLWGVW